MVTWSWSGDDRGDFDLSETGVLTFASVPDFEMPADADGDNEYLVTVEAGDEDSNAATLDVTVTVTNSTGPEEPTITTTGNPSPYRENGTGAVYTFRATDPQGGPLTWSLEGDDDDDFDITSDGGVLTFASPPDFENPTDADPDNTYEITVVVTDEQGLVDRVDVTITVANDPEGVEPTISTRRPPATYGENGTSTVYTFRATDPQGGPITWLLGGVDAGAFDLSATGALTFGSPPDFENPSDVGGDNEYDLTVSATDEDGHSDRLSFTITVTDVNEGPEVTRIGSAPGNVAETDDPAQVLARYTATDPEDPTAAITLWSTSGTDGGDFVMNERGELRFRNQPDHERPADSNRDNVYEFTVRASDGRQYGTFDETVTVSNAEEPGRVTFSASPPVVNSRLIARLADPDGNVQSPAWEWESSPDGSTGWNFISGETSDSYTPATEDVGKYLRATVRYDDGEGSGKQAAGITTNPVRITPPPPPPITGGGGGGGGPVNQPPVFEDADGNAVTETLREIVEDAAPGATIGEPVAATDPDEDTLTYSHGGDDAASFAIDASTGQLTTATALDHETKASYAVTVTATDSSAASSTIAVVIDVTDVDEAPLLMGAASVDYPENDTGPVGSYRATDPEEAAVAWSLSGSDAHAFAIDNGTLAFNTPPDYEAATDRNGDNAHSVVVTASDGTNVATLEVSVVVTNLEEPGMVILSSGAPTVGMEISATLTDPDGSIAGTAWLWEKSADQAAWAAISGAARDAYTPVAGDLGHYLRVTARYADGEGPGKVASRAMDTAVAAEAAGEGEVSSPAEPQLVGPLENLTVSVDGQEAGAVRLAWIPAENAQVHFVVSIKSADLAAGNYRAAKMAPLAGSEGVVSGLEGGTSYYFIVIGMRWNWVEYGTVWGTWSPWVSATPNGDRSNAETVLPGAEPQLVGPLENLTVSVDGQEAGAVRLAWTPGRERAGPLRGPYQVGGPGGRELQGREDGAVRRL